jgi:hypothetical protein
MYSHVSIAGMGSARTGTVRVGTVCTGSLNIGTVMMVFWVWVRENGCSVLVNQIKSNPFIAKTIIPPPDR